MSELRHHHVSCLSRLGFHQMAYSERGPSAASHAVVCVHGLTRNSRDFDPLAEVLAGQGQRVVCPDIVGRGLSDWLSDPSLYAYPQYLTDMACLLARLNVEQVDWVGTSMGGLIGLLLAAQPGTPIRRLVLNDVGPFIPKQALDYIAGYVGSDPVFDTLAAAEAELRQRCAEFGPLDAQGWARVVQHGTRQRADGTFGLAYDPAIGKAFTPGGMVDVNLWPVWANITCPVLVLRGERSNLLPADVAGALQAKAQLVTVPDCGHAPWLAVADQMQPIIDFLAD